MLVNQVSKSRVQAFIQRVEIIRLGGDVALTWGSATLTRSPSGSGGGGDDDGGSSGGGDDDGGSGGGGGGGFPASHGCDNDTTPRMCRRWRALSPRLSTSPAPSSTSHREPFSLQSGFRV